MRAAMSSDSSVLPTIVIVKQRSPRTHREAIRITRGPARP